MVVCQGWGVQGRRLGDACQKRRLVSITCSERSHRCAKIILRGRCEAVAAISQVDEAGVSRKEFFLGPALGSITLPQLSLNPQGETHFLHFQQESVGARDPDNDGENVRQKTLMLKCIAIFRACKFLQEVTAHKLLSNRRAALWKHRCALCSTVAICPLGAGDQGGNVCLAEQTREDGIVHSRV